MEMERDLLKNLIEWKLSEKRKPIVLLGARRVGKTWLVKKLAGQFDDCIECNFQENPEFIKLFDSNASEINVETIISGISAHFNKQIIAGKTLLFLDEIQNCPKAIVALQYFYKNMPDLHVIGSGSYIEFKLKEIAINTEANTQSRLGGIGHLRECIQFFYMYPMSYGEFLTAISNYTFPISKPNSPAGDAPQYTDIPYTCRDGQNLRDLIKTDIDKIYSAQETLHKQLLDCAQMYSMVGGMPEAVKCYIEMRDIEKCRKIQSNIVSLLKNDFKKYSKANQVELLSTLIDSIPFQLGKKFKFSNVGHMRSRELAPALDLLEMAGLVYKVYHSSCNTVPLSIEANKKKYKVMIFDLGLANLVLNLGMQEPATELFVGLELIAYGDITQKPQLYYWHRESPSSTAEVDYVYERPGKIFPVEVKPYTIDKLRSLKQFIAEKKSMVGIRVSKYYYSFSDNLLGLPFYAVSRLAIEPSLNKIREG